MYSVSLFAEHMEQLLDAAQSAAARGEACSAMTILISQDNGIHMIADSDWPLESLALDRGAKSVYRVSGKGDGLVCVEGREGLLSLRDGDGESGSNGAAAARLLKRTRKTRQPAKGARAPSMHKSELSARSVLRAVI